MLSETQWALSTLTMKRIKLNVLLSRRLIWIGHWKHLKALWGNRLLDNRRWCLIINELIFYSLAKSTQIDVQLFAPSLAKVSCLLDFTSIHPRHVCSNKDPCLLLEISDQLSLLSNLLVGHRNNVMKLVLMLRLLRVVDSVAILSSSVHNLAVELVLQVLTLSLLFSDTGFKEHNSIVQRLYLRSFLDQDWVDFSKLAMKFSILSLKFSDLASKFLVDGCRWWCLDSCLTDHLVFAINISWETRFFIVFFFSVIINVISDICLVELVFVHRRWVNWLWGFHWRLCLIPWRRLLFYRRHLWRRRCVLNWFSFLGNRLRFFWSFRLFHIFGLRFVSNRCVLYNSFEILNFF